MLQGRRLPDVDWMLRSPGWAEWERYEPGTYVRVIGAPEILGCATGECWYIVNPNGRAARLGKDHHVEIHEDGTITVSPSIAPRDDDPPGTYHGWLQRGVWSDG